MIVDTSAIVAVLYGEADFQSIMDTLLEGGGLVPAPVLVELARVLTDSTEVVRSESRLILERIFASGTTVAEFDREAAEIAVAAADRFGKGNNKGGKLNLLDLMVYATARRFQLPILCTGRDFITTDAMIHPASRTRL